MSFRILCTWGSCTHGRPSPTSGLYPSCVLSLPMLLLSLFYIFMWFGPLALFPLKLPISPFSIWQLFLEMLPLSTDHVRSLLCGEMWLCIHFCISSDSRLLRIMDPLLQASPLSHTGFSRTWLSCRIQMKRWFQQSPKEGSLHLIPQWAQGCELQLNVVLTQDPSVIG